MNSTMDTRTFESARAGGHVISNSAGSTPETALKSRTAAAALSKVLSAIPEIAILGGGFEGEMASPWCRRERLFRAAAATSADANLMHERYHRLPTALDRACSKVRSDRADAIRGKATSSMMFLCEKALMGAFADPTRPGHPAKPTPMPDHKNRRIGLAPHGLLHRRWGNAWGFDSRDTPLYRGESPISLSLLLKVMPCVPETTVRIVAVVKSPAVPTTEPPLAAHLKHAVNPGQTKNRQSEGLLAVQETV